VRMVEAIAGGGLASGGSAVAAWFVSYAPFLLSGLVGAGVGVIGLFGVLGWQLKAQKNEAKAAARLIYLEIAYNIAMLRASVAAPPTLPMLIATSLWERHSDKLVAVMGEAEIGHVAFPYVQVDAYRVYFSQRWFYMAIHRLRGDDVDWLKKLHDAFKEAEIALRPRVWTGPRLAALGHTMGADGDPFAQRSLPQRLAAAVGQVPVEVLSSLVLILLVFRSALKLGERVGAIVWPNRSRAA